MKIQYLFNEQKTGKQCSRKRETGFIVETSGFRRIFISSNRESDGINGQIFICAYKDDHSAKVISEQ